MKNENELLELFQVEELEKRYEMGWIKETEVTGTVTSGGGSTTTTVGVKITL